MFVCTMVIPTVYDTKKLLHRKSPSQKIPSKKENCPEKTPIEKSSGKNPWKHVFFPRVYILTRVPYFHHIYVFVSHMEVECYWHKWWTFYLYSILIFFLLTRCQLEHKELKKDAVKLKILHLIVQCWKDR